LSIKGNKIGINEIATALGISKSTVSRALNNHPKISEATKQKVLKQAQQLGYQPSIPDLISNKESQSIALVIPHSENIFFTEIISSVREACKLKNYSLFVCESHYDIATEKKCIEQIKALEFKALIYVAHHKTEDLESLNYLAKAGFPVSIIHESPLKSSVSTVILDVHQSFYDSILHLKSNGAERIGLIIDEKENSICHQVEELFEPMLKKEELKYNPDFVCLNDLGTLNIQSTIDRFFAGKQKPNALIFNSYNHAYKAYQYIKMKRLSEEEVLIMSLNSSQVMHYAKPNITYLQLQGAKLGNEATKLVFRQINKGPRTSTKVFFSRLIIKSSSIRV